MKLFFIFISTFFLLLFSMNGGKVYSADATPSSDNHTAREETEGKAIWERLQAKQTACDKLSDDNFEVLGEYFMGQMAGSSHGVMNNMMIRMMGEEGEKQMHVAMGKRNSGCDTSFIPMMGSGFGNMMGGWSGFGLLVSLFWIVLLVDLILLGIWLWKKIKFVVRYKEKRGDY